MSIGHVCVPGLGWTYPTHYIIKCPQYLSGLYILQNNQSLSAFPGWRQCMGTERQGIFLAIHFLGHRSSWQPCLTPGPVSQHSYLLFCSRLSLSRRNINIHKTKLIFAPCKCACVGKDVNNSCGCKGVVTGVWAQKPLITLAVMLCPMTKQPWHPLSWETASFVPL